MRKTITPRNPKIRAAGKPFGSAQTECKQHKVIRKTITPISLMTRAGKAFWGRSNKIQTTYRKGKIM